MIPLPAKQISLDSPFKEGKNYEKNKYESKIKAQLIIKFSQGVDCANKK
jgi:hypothetical protein